MLELRPNCELCDKDLPPEASDANICSYECTYCTQCVETVLKNVCPTCGGGFAARPIRPRHAYRDAPLLGLEVHPASTKRIHSKYSRDAIAKMVQKLHHIKPDKR